MTQLMENTLLGGALILAAAGLRRLFRDRVHPNGWLALWAACLARLLTPLPWRTPLSLYALLGRAAGPAHVVPAPEVPGGRTGGPLSPPVLFWLIAAAGLAVWFLAAWLSVRRRVRETIPLEKSDRRCAALPRGTVLREGPMRGAPLTFGAFRPTVVLSPGLAAPELDYVLAHEGAHVRRRDNLWHYAMAAALIVHWFNPAVWLMAALLRRDVELACDRAALRAFGEDRRAEYARTLVKLSTQAEGHAFCRGFGQKKAEERIIAIMKFRKITFAGVALALTMVLGLTVAFASAPAAEPADAGSQAEPRAECDPLPEDVEIDPQAGITIFFCSPEDGAFKLDYDAERGVWVDRETGAEFAVVYDAEGAFDVGLVARPSQEE